MYNLNNIGAYASKFGTAASKFGMGVGKFGRSHPELVSKGFDLLAEQSLPSAIEFAKQVKADHEKSKMEAQQIEDSAQPNFEELYRQVYPDA